jgi:hypothetical protein
VPRGKKSYPKKPTEQPPVGFFTFAQRVYGVGKRDARRYWRDAGGGTCFRRAKSMGWPAARYFECVMGVSKIILERKSDKVARRRRKKVGVKPRREKVAPRVAANPLLLSINPPSGWPSPSKRKMNVHEAMQLFVEIHVAPRRRAGVLSDLYEAFSEGPTTAYSTRAMEAVTTYMREGDPRKKRRTKKKATRKKKARARARPNPMRAGRTVKWKDIPASVKRRADFKHAVTLYKQMHGRNPESMTLYDAPDMGPADGVAFMASMGTAPDITYRVPGDSRKAKDADVYIHEYETEPLVVTDGTITLNLPRSPKTKVKADGWMHG